MIETQKAGALIACACLIFKPSC